MSSKEHRSRSSESRSKSICKKSVVDTVKGLDSEESKKKQKKKLVKLFKRLTKKERPATFPFNYKDVMKILDAVTPFLAEEKPLVEVSSPVVVVGDIHGQFDDLIRMFGIFDTEKRGVKIKGFSAASFLFLGDYVDRGSHSLECIVLLFSLKMLFPKHYTLLRGNHETRTINARYGFKEELAIRFRNKDESEKLWEAFNVVFSHLPLACLVNGKILCMHGGLSPDLRSLDNIREIPKPLFDPTESKLAMDLMWADPMIDLVGFECNEVRKVSVHFGENIVRQQCNALGLQLIIRAHQVMLNGFSFFANRSLLTIFTAPAYGPSRLTEPNRGAVAVIKKSGRIGFKFLIPPPPGGPTGRGEGKFRGAYDAWLGDDSWGYKRFGDNETSEGDTQEEGAKEERGKESSDMEDKDKEKKRK